MPLSKNWCRCTPKHRQHECPKPHYWLYDASDEEVSKAMKAMLLADSLEVCESLLRGEAVPDSRLRPEWVKRYGRKR